MARMNGHNRRVKALLLERGICQIDIAHTLGVSPGYVGDVINGRKRSQKVYAAIADAIGKPIELLPWDDKKAA